VRKRYSELDYGCSWVRNRGGFSQPSLLHEVEWQGGPAFIAVAEDLDNDGCIDFVLLDLADVGLWILLGDGSGGVREKVFVEVPGLFQPIDVSIVDLDEDRKTDLAVTGLRAVHVLWGTTHGGFLPAIAADYSADAGGDAVKVVAGDFDGDGRKNLAVLGVTATVTPVEYWIDVLSGVGERQFTRRSRTTIREPAG